MLIEIGQGLFYAEGGVRFLGAHLMTRMSVVVLPDGGVAVISPLLPSPPLIGALRALGPVRHLMSPNKIHNQGLPGMAAAFPEAQIWASPGLIERRPGLAYAGTLGDRPRPDWAPVMDQHLTRGNLFFSEVVFFHRASRTLIVADLVENITEATIGGGFARAAARAGHILGRPLPSPEFRMYTDDAEAAAASLDAIAAWPFERILMAHGEIITETAQETFAGLRDFLVEEVRRRPAWRRSLYRHLAARQ